MTLYDHSHLINYSIPVYEVQRKQGIGYIPIQIGSASISFNKIASG